MPLEVENFSDSSTEKFQEMIKHSALSFHSAVLALHDPENSQNENEEREIKLKITADNDISVEKLNGSISKSAVGESGHISYSKFHSFVINISQIVSSYFSIFTIFKLFLNKNFCLIFVHLEIFLA